MLLPNEVPPIVKLSKMSIGVPTLLFTREQRIIIELSVDPTGVIGELTE
jgi:hypothetical protein